MRGSINIALIKYWGKQDDDLIIPLNDSLSLTLHHDNLYSETVIEEGTDNTDELILNGVKSDTKRIDKVLTYIRTQIKNIPAVRIVSNNTFPTASGMASSASGMAALCLSLDAHFNLGISRKDLSKLARLGSGSACRSLYDGLVRWHAGHDHDSSYAEQVYPPSHWPDLRGILVQVSNSQKCHGNSREGMRLSRETSKLLASRVTQVPDSIEAVIDAFGRRDFPKLAELVMRDSNQFHAICMDTWPPLCYLNEDSWTLIHLISTGALQGLAAYTFDAGPNALVLYEMCHESAVLHHLSSALPHATLLPVTL